jgi:allantoinase
MDPKRYAPYPYSALIDRPPLRWPNGKKVAVWVIPNIEFYAYNVPYAIGIPGIPALEPNVLEWARRDYGNRVGVFRQMDMLAERGVRASVALNSDICLEHPRIIERGNELGWEWMGHGETNNQMLAQVAPLEERAIIERTLKVIEDVAGKRPTGWLGPGATQTYHTMGFLEELGVSYVADFMSDDQPFYFNSAKRPLVSVPYTMELNDTHQVNRRAVTGEGFADLIVASFEQLYAEAEATGSGFVLAIAIHPWITGVPHMVRPIGRAFDALAGHEGTWFATGEEIDRAFRDQVKPPTGN